MRHSAIPTQQTVHQNHKNPNFTEFITSLLSLPSYTYNSICFVFAAEKTKWSSELTTKADKRFIFFSPNQWRDTMTCRCPFTSRSSPFMEPGRSLKKRSSDSTLWNPSSLRFSATPLISMPDLLVLYWLDWRYCFRGCFA